MRYLFPPRPQPSLAVTGTDARFPVARIFCVGRNYAAHAAEMGGSVDREAPWYFTKSCHHLALSGAIAPYPPGTSDYHHEIELAVAVGADLFNATAEEAAEAVAGYAVALDMTRRDLQAVAKDKRRPWDTGKDVELSAVVADLTPAEGFTPAGQEISLTVNGEVRQSAPLSDMVWSVTEILRHLSTLYHLAPGDLVLTGTPAGVGAVQPGDRLEGRVDGLTPLFLEIGAKE